MAPRGGPPRSPALGQKSPVVPCVNMGH
jgi:hypothetical protein